MDAVLIIVLFILAAALNDCLGGKKKVPPRRKRPDSVLPPPVPQPWRTGRGTGDRPANRLGFPVPVLKHEPPAENGRVYREPGTLLQQQEEACREDMREREHRLAYARQRADTERRIRAAEQAAEQAVSAAAVPRSQRPDNGFSSLLRDPASARQAIVLSEVLGKPKAYRWRTHR